MKTPAPVFSGNSSAKRKYLDVSRNFCAVGKSSDINNDVKRPILNKMTYVICKTVITGPFRNVFANFKMHHFFPRAWFTWLTAAVFGQPPFLGNPRM
jgi:hypothetical protein